ncbi:MAG: hypothetical protein OEM52_04030 [bacterium]|nr:hypothetical protein [bacterium]
MSTQKVTLYLVAGMLSLSLLFGCSRSSDQKVADAKANVTEAKQTEKDVVAEAAAQAEWLKFKTESAARIETNHQNAVAYKAKMTTANGKQRAQYNKMIDSLELKNDRLKAKLDEYKDDGKSAWEKFRSEYNHDMDELGAALKDFTVENKK